jgi:hypothetical protein
MSNINDGSSLSPVTHYHVAVQGIPLRDWFAGQALAGLISVDGLDAETASWQAYQYADAMLRSRDKRELKP